MENDVSKDIEKHNFLLDSTVSLLKSIGHDVTDLFGENSEFNGLLSLRAEILQMFNVLASCYHQINTVNFLENSDLLATNFEEELDIANTRIIDVRDSTLNQLNTKFNELENFVQKISLNIEKISDYLEMISASSSELDSTVDKTIELILNPATKSREQSILFYLEEVRSKILVPSDSVLRSEINAGQKIVDIISLQNGISDRTRLEEVARMCELLSWGLDSSDDQFYVIQEASIEIGAKLHKEMLKLKSAELPK